MSQAVYIYPTSSMASTTSYPYFIQEEKKINELN